MLFNFLRKKDNIIVDYPTTDVPPRAASSSAPSGAGEMVVEDVFSIKGRGTVATGRVEGEIRINDKASIVKGDGSAIDTKIIGIEAFHKTLDYASTGDNCGLLLEGISREDIERGDVIEIVD